ncbi:Chromodomain-helicase-DNA-binding protein 1-like [Bulinus truncatus]|nr:Chromodomain-helicase-DNA-binding protein 1-like [Bulinus truncatus]
MMEEGVFENAEKSNATILKNVLMQLRKCAIHPYLFNNVEPEPFILAEHLVEASQKMILLDHLLAFLKSRGHKVLIFSQMTRVLDIIQDYLGYRGYNYERLDGSVRGEERFLAVQNFNSNDETFVFLLSTKAGGQGLNLTSADTVIFIDSDFNPQNDLQAAARVHRIGQDRPVKIIRLIGRNTVEEIIMSRAEAKLKLTEKVIENGKFSLNSEDKNASRYAAKELQEILKFGLENLLAEDKLDENMDFEKILGSSENGRWNSSLKEEHDKKMSIEKELTIKDKKPESSDTDTAPQNIYIFEGRDYSHMPSAADITAFERLILAEKQLLQEEYCKTRSREGATSQGDISLIAPRRRMVKVLSPEEQEERLKKRQEQAEKMAQKQIEKQLKKALAKQRKRESIWRAHGYDSANIELKENEDAEKSMLGNDTDDENNDETSANQSLTINYVSGDVTHPVDAKTDVNIMVMCADDSGKWGKGGLFSAMSARSKQPQAQYELAGEMKDLHLGHCHLIPVNDSESRGKGIDLLALIIAQKRTKKSNVLSGIKFSALEKGLQKIHQVAKERKASVHLPRIGYDTPEFNWYGTERLIRKHLASKGIPTYIYYFPRKKATKRKHVLKTPKVSDVNTDTASTDAKKQKIAKTENNSASPLPALFSGIAVHFYNLEDDVIKKLTRYVIAYPLMSDTIFSEEIERINCLFIFISP